MNDIVYTHAGDDDDDDDDDDGEDDDDDDDDDNINRKAALETPFTSILLPHAFLAHKRLHGSKNNSTQQRRKNITKIDKYTQEHI